MSRRSRPWHSWARAGGRGLRRWGTTTSMWAGSPNRRFGLPAHIDVVVPHRRKPRPPARAHECHGLDRRDITTYQRVPVTRMARTLVDLSDLLTPYQLAFVIHE